MRFVMESVVFMLGKSRKFSKTPFSNIQQYLKVTIAVGHNNMGSFCLGFNLSLLMMTQEAFVENVDQDQNVHSDL